jgi:hypothetical protein
MQAQLARESVVGQPLVAIAHSPYSRPEFIVQGIGPASFRSHYLTLGNGSVLELPTAELTVAALPDEPMPGETAGVPAGELIGRRVHAVALDDTESVLVILEGGIFLKDANDGFYGNPLLAGHLSDHYTEAELASFVDYWNGKPCSLGPESAA